MDEFDRLTNLRGWTTDKERAQAIGIATSTMSRIRNRVDSPGTKFVDRSLTVLGVPYGVLFKQSEPERQAVA